MQWRMHEIELTAEADPADPTGVACSIRWQGPDGRERTGEAFWDGGRTWRARLNVPAGGDWSWSSESGVPGLDGQAGTFQAGAYRGDNPLRKHGAVRVADGGRHLAHADGTPFFYLADTAWNGLLNSTMDDWRAYCQRRVQQRFTAVQAVATPWRAATEEMLGQSPWTFDGQGLLQVRPEFFAPMDAKLAFANEAGLAMAVVMLWAHLEDDPGQALSEDACVRLCRYLAARWGGYHVMWLICGDAHLQEADTAERWRRIGRQVFAGPHAPATVHPMGKITVADAFGDEPWCDIVPYQSSHTMGPEQTRWLTTGPPATDWQARPAKPHINLEPCYEGHPSFIGQHVNTAFDVRRAAWWSLLVMPTAGITFGCNEIWTWMDEPGPAPGHERIATIGPTGAWRDGLELAGVHAMTHIRAALDVVDWYRLTPAPQLLARQPGQDDPFAFVAAAMTDDAQQAVIYTPQPDALSLDLSPLPRPLQARWMDAATGRWSPAVDVPDPKADLAPPADGDHVLVLSANPL